LASSVSMKYTAPQLPLTSIGAKQTRSRRPLRRWCVCLFVCLFEPARRRLRCAPAGHVRRLHAQPPVVASARRRRGAK
jgi:hypothetical protein